jgi:hypothetical protein
VHEQAPQTKVARQESRQVIEALICIVATPGPSGEKMERDAKCESLNEAAFGGSRREQPARSDGLTMPKPRWTIWLISARSSFENTNAGVQLTKMSSGRSAKWRG